MGFRDDAEAARARVDALERENQELRAKLAGRDASSTEEPPRRRGSVVLLLLALVLAAGSGAAALADMGPIALVGLVVAAALASAWFVSGLLLIVGPNEVLVLSGRKTRLPDGRWRGYRPVRAGRVLRIPLLETADWLSLRVMSVETRVEQAGTRDKATVSVD